MNTKTTQADLSTDDDGWFDALAGRPADGARATATLEASLLRAQLLRTAPGLDDSRADADMPAATPPTPAESRDFRRRLELERARDARACAGCASRAERVRAWLSGHLLPLAGAFASLVIAAMLVERPTTPAGPEVPRAPASAMVQLLVDPDPRGKRDDLARQLARLGADVRRYERLGRFGLDARVTLPPPAATVQALQALGLTADADGVLRVEVESPAR